MSHAPPPRTTIDVAHVARLARLALTPDELASIATDLAQILAYVDELRAVDVSGVPPTSHPLPFERALREDLAGPVVPTPTALAASAQHDGEAFIVPKVL